MKKITLITGAGRGIGFGIARLFAKKKNADFLQKT